ncbi:hypothetical protein PVAG01_10975 [Phlyctema vagabunda]|uniref:FAD-binding domain-containing protein n=1 Tax=Phlyctema vagabunda TaxID=108571 RepID=A0ABR4P4F3_9HELO
MAAGAAATTAAVAKKRSTMKATDDHQSKNQESLRVLIIGAGSAGLLIAHALKKAGIASSVFEADATSTARPRDWSFGVYWAQSPLASVLDDSVVARIQQSQVDDRVPTADDVLPIYNSAAGELICDAPSPYSLRLQRRRWLGLLSEGVDVQYGKRVVDIQTDGEMVTATFSDGTRERGNLLFGTEGAHSPTREFLVGSERARLIPSPVVGSVAITHMPREAALKIRAIHPRHVIGLHPVGYFTWMGVHESAGLENLEDWKFMIMMTWTATDEESTLPSKGPELVVDMRERAKVCGPLFRECYEAIPDDAPMWHSRLSLWPTQEWDDRNGTVTLAGDAAHPMTFHRGQGLNNAILDAADFMEKLNAMRSHTAEELKKAVRDYETGLWPRGNEAVRSSELNTLMVHDWERVLESPLVKHALRKD